jgi:hypothetical protein
MTFLSIPVLKPIDAYLLPYRRSNLPTADVVVPSSAERNNQK